MRGTGLTADAPAPSPAAPLTRSEREAMRSMRHADGARMERGDRVAVAGGSGPNRYEIIGWHLGRGLVMLRDAGGRVSYAPPSALVRA